MWLTFHMIWEIFYKLVYASYPVPHNENLVRTVCLIASLTIDYCEFYCLPICFRLQLFFANLLACHQTSCWCAKAHFNKKNTCLLLKQECFLPLIAIKDGCYLMSAVETTIICTAVTICLVQLAKEWIIYISLDYFVFKIQRFSSL